jgi:methyl-accepting chemotaxis protein
MFAVISRVSPRYPACAGAARQEDDAVSFRPTIRAKLSLMAGMLLLPVLFQAFHVWRDISEKVAVSSKELQGLEYLAAIWPVQAFLATSSGDAPPADLVAAPAAASAANDPGFASVSASSAFARSLEELRTFSGRFGKINAVLAASSAGQSLIAAVGDGSGLILDPELDSYYAMDAVTAKIPAMLAEVQSLAALLRPMNASYKPSNEEKTAQVAFATSLARAAAGIEMSLTRSFGPDAESPTARALRPRLDEALSAAREIAGQLAQANGNPHGDASGRGLDTGKLNAEVLDLASKLDVLWRASAAELENLIGARIGRFRTELSVTLGSTLLIALMAAGAAFLIGRSILGGVRGLVVVLRELASGAMDAPVPKVDASDEIGDVSRGLRDFRDSILERNKAASTERELAVRTTQAATLRGVAAEIEASLLEVAGKLDRSAVALQRATGTVSVNADETSARIVAAVAALDGSSREVDTVTVSISDLARSIEEIARRAAEAADATSTASTCAADAARRSAELKRCTDEIAAIATLISDIASQTNLLALNATIEAARAGQAGRGFAVVAQEVKALADQTTRATGEIDQRVNAIRAMTLDVTGMVGGIAASIEGLQEISRSIATGVEEQGAVTSRISASLMKAAAGTSSVIAGIAELPAAAVETGRIARELGVVAASLAQDSGDLRISVDDLLRRLAA